MHEAMIDTHPAGEIEPGMPFGTLPVPGWLAGIVAVTRRLPRNVIGKRLASLARSLGSRAHGGAVDVEVLGARMRLHTRGNACEKRLLFTPHFFDPEDLAVLEPMIGPDFVFIDAGANVGAYTLFVAARGGEGATVIAVEPHPVARQRLAFNIAASGHAATRIVPHALSDRPGSVRLQVRDGNIGNTTISVGERTRFHDGGVVVETETLLALARREGLERIDAVKMDIEGHEDVVLSAFFATAPEALWPKLLIFENNRALWSRDLVAEIAARGYDVLKTGPGNAVLRRRVAATGQA
jgi:FkbM family methyltransferase